MNKLLQARQSKPEVELLRDLVDLIRQVPGLRIQQLVHLNSHQDIRLESALVRLTYEALNRILNVTADISRLA